MTANRSRKQVVKYSKKLKSDKKASSCVFCDIEGHPEKVIQETKHFRVIQNIFPYSLWDSQKVKSHLMIIPKTHTNQLGGLGGGAGEEFLNLIDKYESDGFNIYARAPSSKLKTIEHQHTHLIQPYGKIRKFVFFLRKPYIRLHY